MEFFADLGLSDFDDDGKNLLRFHHSPHWQNLFTVLYIAQILNTVGTELYIFQFEFFIFDNDLLKFDRT